MNAFQVVAVNPVVPSYSLSHSEAAGLDHGRTGRLLGEPGRPSGSTTPTPSLDPNLNGQADESAVVASLGYKPKDGR